MDISTINELDILINQEAKIDINNYKIMENNCNKTYYNHIIQFHVGQNYINPYLIKAIINIKNIEDKRKQSTLLFITINNTIIPPPYTVIPTASPIHKLITIIKNEDMDYFIVNVENKGMDIGGFYISLNIIYTRGIMYNMMTKLHTKTNVSWLEDLLYPYIYESRQNFENFNSLSLGSYYTLLPIDNLQLRTIHYFLKKKRNIDINSSGFVKMLKTKDEILQKYINKYGKPRMLKDKKFKDMLKQRFPCFYAGSIFTIKKIVIDNLIDIIPLYSYNLFKYGYVIDDGITISLPHAIERLVGYLSYFLEMINSL